MDWFGRRRQQYIDVMLSWYGRFSAKQIVDFFGISRVQASKDIAFYRETHPERMEYSTRERRYQWAVEEPNDEHLEEPEAIFEFASDHAPLPYANRIPKLRRSLAFQHLHNITWAISNQKQVEMTYTSQSSPLGDKRIIQPHQFVYASSRWHVRAYCFKRKDFRDFSLSRILASERVASTSEFAKEEHDSLWHTQVTISIKPHPKLASFIQKSLIREYCMIGGKAYFDVRAALVVYALQENRIAPDDSYSAKEFHLVLDNRDELGKYLW